MSNLEIFYDYETYLKIFISVVEYFWHIKPEKLFA